MKIIRTSNENRLRVIPAGSNPGKKTALRVIPTKTPHKDKKKTIQNIENFLDRVTTPKENIKLGTKTLPVNPSLNAIIPMVVKDTHIPYALAILNHYNDKYPHIVRWNDAGELYSPVTNINILRIIQYYLTNDVTDAETKYKIGIMNTIAPINSDYVRHGSAKKAQRKKIFSSTSTRKRLRGLESPPTTGKWVV